MRPKSIEIKDVVSMFEEQKVMTRDALSKKAQCSGKTILRRLKEHGYYTSYNMNGRYYTLPEIANFDDEGFWTYECVCFNKLGGLREIVTRMIDHSEMGYTPDELNKRVNTNCSNHLLRFVREGVIARRKYGNFYVYFSTDRKKQEKQVEKREQHGRLKEIPESDGYMSVQRIDDRLVIHVLLEFVNNRKAAPEEVTEALMKKNIRTRKEVVEEIFRRYGLFKKRTH